MDIINASIFDVGRKLVRTLMICDYCGHKFIPDEDGGCSNCGALMPKRKREEFKPVYEPLSKWRAWYDKWKDLLWPASLLTFLLILPPLLYTIFPCK